MSLSYIREVALKYRERCFWCFLGEEKSMQWRFLVWLPHVIAFYHFLLFLQIYTLNLSGQTRYQVSES